MSSKGNDLQIFRREVGNQNDVINELLQLQEEYLFLHPCSDGTNEHVAALCYYWLWGTDRSNLLRKKKFYHGRPFSNCYIIHLTFDGSQARCFMALTLADIKNEQTHTAHSSVTGISDLRNSYRGDTEEEKGNQASRHSTTTTSSLSDYYSSGSGL